MSQPVTAPLLTRVPAEPNVPPTWAVIACEHGCCETWTIDVAEFDPRMTAYAVYKMLVCDLLIHEATHGLDPDRATEASFRAAWDPCALE